MIGDTNVRAMPVAAGTQISTLEVGTLVKMNISGTPWEWKIVHQGLPGSMYDSSCDGCWLLLENIHSKRIWDSTNNDYQNSDIQAWLQSDFFSMLDSGIQSQIKQVKIPYVNGTNGSPVVSGANGLSCKIFLLGGYEVGFDDYSMYPEDGTKLDYFELGSNSSSDNRRLAYYNGDPTAWALRSVHVLAGDNISISAVVDNGGSGYWIVSYDCGIRPALILPSTALVDDDLNVLAA